MGKHIRETFVDKHGNWVAVGDKVIGHGIPATITHHNSDPMEKPFTAITPNGSIVHFNSEYTEKRDW